MNTKTITLTLACLSFITLFSQPYFEWGRNMGGADYDFGSSIATDAQGNVYTIGTFYNTADFDPGLGTYNLTSAGDEDIFITKLDAAGKLVWAVQIGGSNNDIGLSITVDNKGDVLVTGSFEGTVDFDPGSGTTNFTAAGYEDVFVCKLNSSGSLVWARQMGGILPDIGNGIVTDSRGNVYSTGIFSGSADFNPGTSTYTLTSGGSISLYISKLSPAGNFVWAKSIGGSANTISTKLALDGKGNVFTTGYFESTVDFDPGISTFNMTAKAIGDAFVMKLDSFGNFYWARQFSGNKTNGLGIAIDPSGNVYTAGAFFDTCDFDPGANTKNLISNGNQDAYVSKLDASGNFVWAKTFGGSSDDLAYGIAADATGVYTTGAFYIGCDFDPGPNTYTMTTSGGSDIFISKLSASGNFVWAKQIGGTGFDNRGYDIKVDSKRNLYSTGFFNDTADFDPNPSATLLVSNGSVDAFVQKMSQCLTTTSTISPAACVKYKSPSGRYTWTTSGTYTDTLVNAGGCDSVITIHLKIKKNSTSLLTVTACNKYVSPNGKHKWTSSGSYNDTIPNQAGCDSIITVQLTIHTVDISMIVNGRNLVANQAGAKYQWIDCFTKQPHVGDTTKSLYVMATGRYQVVITLGSCTDTSSCVFVDLNAINTPAFNGVEVYPNPTGQFVTVSVSQPFNDAIVKIVDLQGRVVLVKNGVTGNASTIDLSSQASGIYIVEVYQGDLVTRVKLLKQ